MAKAKVAKVDGELSAKDIKNIRAAIRQVWSWSYSRRLCIARATDKAGFARCEGKDHPGKRVPKVFADHIETMGHPLAPDYIKRMWCHSSKLQALCDKCHRAKTNAENKALDWATAMG